MGMIISGIRSGRRVIQIKNLDGSVAATISVSSANKKKTKRLNYNFKSVSSQIMLSKNSNSAGKVVTRARGMVAMLLRKVKSGEYDDLDLEHAIIHARKMERIAKKRQKHLEQEEEIEQKGKTEEAEDIRLEDLEGRTTEEEQLESSEKELKQLMEEYQELMQESIERLAKESMEQLMEEMQMDELAEDFSGAVYEMEPEDFEKLKKKHRADEMREIMDADMKYLRAVFNKLEKERQALSSGAKSFADNLSGVSMELSGLEMPVEMPQMPPAAEGGSVDVMV